MADEKRVFSPTGVDEMLNGWLIHTHKCRDRHDEASRLYAKGVFALGVPALVVSTVVGSSVVTALASNATPAWWVAALSIASAVLAALQTFMDFGGRSDKHRSTGVKYKAAIRLLEQLKVRRSEGESITKDELDSLRTSIDTLEEAAPVILPKIHDRIEKKYQDMKYVKAAIDLYAN